jgi:glycerol-3-phosphate dehydrogenase
MVARGMIERDLQALAAREHDLLVIGGGIYGAAAAWDAAQRGLAVALVEARDFGSGASWNSLKTIHGGLRHLQRFEARLTRESMRERRALLGIAPEIVRPLPFLVPTHGHGSRGREAFALGLLANDALTFDRNRGLPPAQQVPRGRLLSRRDALARVPGLPRDGLTGAAVWVDAQVTHSERLLLGFLQAAAAAGAALANHVEVVALLRRGERVTGARLRDRETDAEHEVRARLLLNATGPGMDELLRLAGITRPALPLLEAMNLVLRRPIVTDQAVGARSRGRYLFLVPWRDRSILGTAYAPAGERPSVREFLEEAAQAFPWADLALADVTLVHRGRVPGRDATNLLDRTLLVDHSVEDRVRGLLSLLGVKYTTARAGAEKAVDLALARLGRRAVRCRTAQTPLAEARPLAGTRREQALRAVREEMALHLSDAVLRRLDLGGAGPPESSSLEVVRLTMAEELGWDARRQAEESRRLQDVYSIDT